MIYRCFLVRSYLKAEISRYDGRLAGREIRTLWTMLAHQDGGMLNVADLSRNLDLDARTINRYLGLLEDLLLIRILKPWFKNVGKRLVKSPKVYIRDSGIVDELPGISGL